MPHQSNSNFLFFFSGFSVKIFGFSDVVAKTIVDLMEKLKNIVLNEKEFELIKDEMRNQIKGQMNLVPSMRGYVNFFSLILRDFVSNEKIIVELDKLTLKKFNHYCKNIFNILYLKIFIHGTFDLERSKDLTKNILDVFKNSTELSPKGKDYMNLHSNLSGYHIFREHLQNSYNINHAILNYYQIGEETIENIVNANMVKALCGYIYFTELRIKEQLGYTAKGKIFSEGNVIYYMIMVQGSTKTPDVMDLRIENLLGLMRNRIKNTDDEKFETIKKSIRKKIGKKDKTLKHRSFRQIIFFNFLDYGMRLF